MSDRLGIFEAFGVEVEYAIVDADTLDVSPVADRLIEAVAGEPVSEIERGDIAWSNELALHVLELKTNGPTRDLAALPDALQANLDEAGRALSGLGARLMPGAMHPWMDPAAESKLWPHEYNDVYRAFDRIFGCSGHGWTNLQSVHVNFPFADDDEFHRLHAAIRLVLPLVPALAASSPIADGRVAGPLDYRLVAYAGNAVRVPQVAGSIVPEPVSSEAGYTDVILQPLYEALAPHDPEGILRHDWANARGAIARFGRGSIEIRLLDSQECATADVAMVAAVADVVRGVERSIAAEAADAVPTEELAAVLHRTIREGERADGPDGAMRRTLGLSGRARTSGLAWAELLDRFADASGVGPFADWLELGLSRGPLARRLLAETGPDPSHERLVSVYRTLCDCLVANAFLE